MKMNSLWAGMKILGLFFLRDEKLWFGLAEWSPEKHSHLTAQMVQVPVLSSSVFARG